MQRLRSFLKNLSIQRKISIAILVTCCTALATASAAIFFTQLLTFRQSFTRDLRATGQMLGDNTTASITFKDNQGAEKILGAVRAKPFIIRASLDLPDTSEFAAFPSTPLSTLPQMPPEDGIHFQGGYLALNQAVVLAGERIATLRLLCDYQTEYAHSLRLYSAILIVVLLISVLLALALSSRLQRRISAPILQLARTAQSIAEKKDYSLRAPKLSEDEVGRLSEAFNEMLSKIQTDDQSLRDANLSLEREIEERKRTQEKIEQLHKELMLTSRLAGMAEVATGVLHNVGNVLNSVNVSAGVLGERLSHSCSSSLAKLCVLLDSHRADLGSFLTNDPKGRRVPEFLSQLSVALEEERAHIASETQSLVKNIEHIKEIVAMQQNYAKVAGVIEDLPPASLIDDAMRLNSGAFIRHGVQVQREFPEVPLVRVDKHKVLQILVNLFRNAKYAMDATGRPDKVLTLGLERNGNGRIKVVVRDNGIGIPPENLTRIFSHGFTTRTDGHGFGLHTGALAAKEMGGSLQAFSEGPGTGATFILELPIASPPEQESSAP
ncbi:Integral membrane sensor signal transduction histidine kinase (fragment) [Verrucomicrobia bacterium]